jgi:hypothetical protein
MVRNKAKSYCESLGMQLATLESAQKINNITGSIEKGTWLLLLKLQTCKFYFYFQLPDTAFCG